MIIFFKDKSKHFRYPDASETCVTASDELKLLEK